MHVSSAVAKNTEQIGGACTALSTLSAWLRMFVVVVVAAAAAVVVVVVVTSPSGNVYIGRKMLRRDEEFQQI